MFPIHFPEAVGLLQPHERDIGSSWRAEQGGRAQKAARSPVFQLKSAHRIELPLVLGVGILRPVVNHIQEAHAFKAHKFPVIETSQFTVNHRSDRTGFTNEVRPSADAGKAQTFAVLASTSKGRAHGKTPSVVSGPARVALGSIVKGEP
jgi:hypothetical protein